MINIYQNHHLLFINFSKLKSNTTYYEVDRLRDLVKAVDETLQIYKTNEEFQKKVSNLVEVTKTEFVQAIVGGKIDTEGIRTALDSILKDDVSQFFFSLFFSFLN